MPQDILTLRDLNRATLARQMLLHREQADVRAAIERLAGMQAQEAKPPYIGLWARLDPFVASDLTKLLQDRSVIRATAMRGTIHLMSAADYAGFRTTLQPMLTAGMESIMRERTAGLDIPAAKVLGRAFFGSASATFDDLRDHLSRTDPTADIRAIAYAVRMHVPLVQVPTETKWGFPSAAQFALADAWIGRPFAEEDAREVLVLRYLAAFGPASVADFQAWSAMKGAAEVFKALRPALMVFKDGRKRDLFDLPDAPRPGAEAPAPVRFLPEYDNLLLAHADRTRVISETHRKRVVTPNLRVLSTFLIDGFVAGTWKIERKRAAATLMIEPFEPLPADAEEPLAQEGERLLQFVEEDARHEVMVAGA